MSRYASYFRALATGYGLLGVNIAYSLAVVPLALAHLGTETFGLWALTMQIGTIVQLADAGMTGALNRIFVDYKDDKASAGYRQVFYTMWLAFSLLGVAIIVGLHLLAPQIVNWLTIPPHLKAGYALFLAAYGAVLGFNFVTKSFAMLPFVHQRSDILNVISSIGLIVGFAVLWIGLNSDWGLWSLLAGLTATHILNSLMIIWQCFRLHYFPKRSDAPMLSRKIFLEVFDYGKDRLLATAGLTTLQAAPTFLITRLLGLEANAAWSVVSRMNLLCLQLISRVSDLSYPVLAEMHVRSEQQVMRRRFSHLLVIGLGIAVLCAVGIATCNRDFVQLWTHGKIASTPLLDGLLACWLLTLVLQRFLYVPVSIERAIKDIRHLYLLETLVVILSGLLLLKPAGGIWLVAASLPAASLLITLPRFFRKSARVLECTGLQLFQPMTLLGLRVMLPAMTLVAASMLLPAATHWGWLILKAGTVGACMTLLLSALPELRQLAIEAMHRLFPATQRGNAP